MLKTLELLLLPKAEKILITLKFSQNTKLKVHSISFSFTATSMIDMGPGS